MMDSLIETGKLREKRKSGDFGDSSDEEVLLWNVYINWDYEKVKTDYNFFYCFATILVKLVAKA